MSEASEEVEIMKKSNEDVSVVSTQWLKKKE